MLHINDLSFRIEGRPLFEHATAAIPEGHKVGLVGRNGTGKTTLLRLIAGELHADDGTIGYPKNARLAHVSQEAPGGPETLLETVLAAHTELAELTAEAETAHDPHRISEIHTRLGDIDAHSAPARAARILSGLGFDEEAQARPCAEFSGGWRMRVALAGALFDGHTPQGLAKVMSGFALGSLTVYWGFVRPHERRVSGAESLAKAAAAGTIEGS